MLVPPLQPLDAMKTRAIVILALVGGCNPHGGGDDVEPPKDGGRTGLTLRWQSRPEHIPSDDSRIVRAAFQLSNLRVVGDAGPVGFGERALEWARDVEPEVTSAPEAPSGLYARCLFELVAPNGGYAYEIEGTVERDDDEVPFTIRDRGTSPISIDFSKMLAAGGEARVEIEVGIEKLISAVDFADVPLQNGRLIVEEGGTQLPRVRLQLASTFEVED
jgi:hypothetical protein